MKILLWSKYYFPSIGGLQMMARLLALQLCKQGHQVIVFADQTHSTGGTVLHGLVDGIEVYYFPFQAALASKNPTFLKEMLTQATRIVEQFAPDVANIHGWYEFFAFFQVRVLKNVPFFLTIHGLLEKEHYKARSCCELWDAARGVNTVSHSLMETLTGENWRHASLCVIHNGISFSRIEQQVQTRKNHVVMLGRFTSEKCFDVGLHAFKQVKEALPDATLCLAGGGDDREMLTRLRQELQLEEAVEMPGMIHPDQVHHVLDPAAVVWIPSLYESFSLVALEAARRRRAVIASNVFGLKETVAQGKTGLLIEPQNPHALAQATLALLQEPAVYEQMGRDGYERGARLFSIERCASNYIRMYESR